MTVARPKDWQTEFAAGAIRRHCAELTDYVVTTSPTAWQVAQDQFQHEPKALEYITSQEKAYNEGLAAKLPRAEYVVGVGGGKALDAAKYVACKTQAKLILAPTIVSTGSVFQFSFPERRDGVLSILRDIAQPQWVLFDTDIIRAAPPYMNAAGMAECISWLSQLASWRWWCDEGLTGPAWDQAVADEVVQWVRRSVALYTDDLDAEGRPGPQAIGACAQVNVQRFDLRMWNLKANHSIDHLTDNTMVWALKRELLHGEAVALGSLLSCHLHGVWFNQTKAMYDACGTRYRPSQIGCSWQQIRQTLDRICDHIDAQGSDFKVYFHHRELDDETFAAMAARIDAEN